jgi:hypothetical protein
MCLSRRGTAHDVSDMLGSLDFVSSPGDVPVWPHQDELAFIKCSDVWIVDMLDPQRDLPARERTLQVSRFRSLSKDKEDKSFAKQVESGAAIGKPGMRGARARPRRRNVDTEIVRRRRRAVRYTYRRVVVAMTDLKPE